MIGYKLGISRIGPPVQSLAQLVKTGIVKFNTRTNVVFKPLECNYIIAADCIDQNTYVSTTHKNDNNQPVQIRCVIYEGYHEFGKQYFIVDKIDPIKKLIPPSN